MKRLVALLLALAPIVAVGDLSAQTQRKNIFIPPPLRISVPFETAWKTMQEVLSERLEVEVAEEDMARGYLLTAYIDYIDGPLTRDHIAKVGEPIKLSSANWVAARYRYRIGIELIEARQTMVLVDAEIQGLKRELLGGESWVDIKTNGRLERDLLNLYGTDLFGSDFSLERPKKGFWEHSPGYVPRPEDRIPEVASPERPPR